jgi:pimeloyl-ACP methyl ester carboxylesterase
VGAVSTRGEVSIPAAGGSLGGELHLPEGANAIVLFAHGSGSSRFSPRNRLVASELHKLGLGTLLMDLLREDEAESRRNVFDIELLASRLLQARRWLEGVAAPRALRVGYFGASTGAAAALVAAATEPENAHAVVSRGGRPDLAAAWLPRVQAPTLLIVGERDSPVLEWNEEAYRLLRAQKKLIVVPGATHLFEEPGTLEEAAAHAGRWFVQHLIEREPGRAQSRKAHSE